MRARTRTFGDFQCAHCLANVSSAHMFSGVNNRNHCPYCLWSRHLDLFSVGDRLSACKAPMKPIALTMKRSRNKYSRQVRGELMLVHECTECGALAINRIAADDHAENVMVIFESSLALQQQMGLLAGQGIAPLGTADRELVLTQLYGRTPELAAPCY